ncbi:MAG: MerR family transcriptional regulator [Aeromicrobium erythreum]
MTIGDFAARTHLSIRTLRHYHRTGVLQPAEVDPLTGYRRYTPEQIGEARLVHRLRELDLPLADVRTVLATQDPRAPRVGGRRAPRAARVGAGPHPRRRHRPAPAAGAAGRPGGGAAHGPRADGGDRLCGRLRGRRPGLVRLGGRHARRRRPVHGPPRPARRPVRQPAVRRGDRTGEPGGAGRRRRAGALVLRRRGRPPAGRAPRARGPRG